MSESSAPFDGPRRAPTYPRQPEELHIPPAANTIPPNDPHQFPPSKDYGSNPFPPSKDYSNPSHPPSLSIQQSAPPQFSGNPPQNNTLPGALQPGHGSRQGHLPTLSSSQLSLPMSPTKQGSVSQLQGYTQSSPTGMDQQQRYKALGSTSEGSKFSLQPSAGFLSKTPQTTTYSPLGLADIRPLADIGKMEEGSPTLNNGEAQLPANSSYYSPWSLYALDWCKWPVPPNSGAAGKIAVGSYLEDTHNYIQILEAQYANRDYNDPENDPGLDFVKTAEATHSYPVTRILWEPPSSQKQSTDLLATSGDHLRLWSLPSNPNHPQYYGSNSINRSSMKMQPLQKLSPLALLSNSKTPEHTAPITSLDWNVVSPSLIITSSIDTTCTIWDIPTLTAKTQLIAHDKEVFDVRFCANSVDVFVSCGADGSVRMFDLRSLEHSTIIYEPSDKHDKAANPGDRSPPTQGSWPPPLLRIAASPHDAHLLATFAQDSNIIRVLDVRQPGQALLELKGHSAAINCMEWSPNRRGTVATGGDDSLVLIWDLINQNNAASLPLPPQQPQPQHSGGASTVERGPAGAWVCDYEVSNISWAPHTPGANPGTGRDWLGVCGGRGLWGVAL
ncbi:hypothetical protein FQN57_007037 [Myotisia sp. PD_48]|nr:hypothetical protein FQN57_007037 [Myotisia sp. PD_48]